MRHHDEHPNPIPQQEMPSITRCCNEESCANSYTFGDIPRQSEDQYKAILEDELLPQMCSNGLITKSNPTAFITNTDNIPTLEDAHVLQDPF
jgi:hypothetical protein